MLASVPALGTSPLGIVARLAAACGPVVAAVAGMLAHLDFAGRAMSTKRGVAQLAIAALVTTALSACGSVARSSAGDAAEGDVVVHPDATRADTATGTDATGGVVDAQDERSDANGIDGAAWDVDATMSDGADALRPHDAQPDVQPDAGIDVADGGCACFPFDNGAGQNQAVITTSLECFSIHARWEHEYAVYAAEPCIGLPPGEGIRRESIYADRNLIGIWTNWSGSGDPIHEYFYDATTKVLVGAVRYSPYMGDDRASCSPMGPLGAGRYNRVRAGILPDCDFSGGWVSCPRTSDRYMCPQPRDAGTPDAHDAAIDEGVDAVDTGLDAEDAVLDAVDAGEG